MKVRFACPSCAAAGVVDAIHIGKQVRCKHCGAHFTIPAAETDESDVYALDEPVQQPAREVHIAADQAAVFVPARGDRGTSIERPRQPRRPVSGPTPQRAAERGPEFPWQSWLIRACAALVLLLIGITFFAPHGTWLAGCTLIAIGGVLVPVAYLAGAYGAFSEDMLYGLLYIFFPVYIGYYLVTRWEDLWPWMLCATVGVGLVLIGTELIRWSGVVV